LLKFNRVFSKEDIHPYDEINWVKRSVKFEEDDVVVFESNDLEFPDFWSETAYRVCAKNYFLLDSERTKKETSLKQLINRVVDTITDWGFKDGYFDEENGKIFNEELKWLMVNQYTIFNTPVMINFGSGINSTGSACFTVGIEDNLEDIYHTVKLEADIFKNGSGSGINFSPLRGKGESLSGGGTSSGVMEFLKIYDSSANAIKSGGRSRRSARLVCLDADHPEIEEFIDSKVIEERKAQALIDAGFSGDFNGEAYKSVQYQNANNSIRLTDDFMEKAINDEPYDLINRSDGKVFKTVKARDILRKAAEATHRCGDPGVMFHDTTNKWFTCQDTDIIKESNPCFTGDTLIAVADGRDAISFKQLVDEGKDVPTYTLDKDGNIIVKTMMNPRKTRENADVYKITFDSGLEVKCTYDHKFLTPKGVLKPLSDFSVGDSIKSSIKSYGKFTDVIPFKDPKKNKKKAADYKIWEINGKKSFDHRLIAEFKNKGPIDNGYVIHHKNRNPLDNSLDNLEILSKEDHDKLHAKDMMGKNNPIHRATEEEKKVWFNNISEACKGVENGNSCKITNEKIIQRIKNHVKGTLFNLFTGQMWRDLGLPYLAVNNHSRDQYRLPSISAYCEAAGVEMIKHDAYLHLVRKHENLKEGGYKFTLDAGNRDFIIEKTCEGTGEKFFVNYDRRHCSYISHKAQKQVEGKERVRFVNGKINEKYLECGNTKRRLERTFDLVKYYKENKDKHKNFKKEYKEANTIIRPGNIFCPSVKFLKENFNRINSVEDLISLAEESLIKNGIDDRHKSEIIGDSYNHKIVSIEYYGNEDVYDCTVEGTHLILVGGQEKINEEGKKESHFVVASNCGEFVNKSYTSCNLSTINLPKLIDNNCNNGFNVEGFSSIIKLLITAKDLIVDNSDYPFDRIKRNSNEYRPLGLGINALGEFLMLNGIPYDSKEGRELASGLVSFLTSEAYKQSAIIAEDFGPFKYYESNINSVNKVMKLHEDAADDASERCSNPLAFSLLQKASYSFRDLQDVPIRNNAVTLAAPQGTTGLVLGSGSAGIEPCLFHVIFKVLAGGGSLTLTNPSLEKALFNLGYDEDSVKLISEYVSKNGTVEGSIINEDHLPIFDCSLKPFNGERSIHYNGHVDMMAAIQPFYSMSISKTVNLSEDCTVDDIFNIYIDSWKKGLKSITVYRDNSKGIQPMKMKANKEVEEVVKETFKPVKRSLPSERTSLTHKFAVAGHEGYLTIGLYEDGTPGELFIRMSKEGSIVSGMTDSFAKSISLGLQYGIPLEVLIDKFIDTRFEPSGVTENPEIPIAKSLMDYIFKFLSSKFMKKSEEAEEIVPVIQDKSEVDNQHSVDPNAPPCSSCGSMTFRNGACYLCLTCGASSGCS
jgi:ribonucleotide reductase alpha subunit